MIGSTQAVEMLLEGNRRFVRGDSTMGINLVHRRAEVTTGQHPFSVVVCCSDSRVPPEIVFDQTIGNIFVVRSAGHCLGPMMLGSIEYAVEHLGVPFVMILGHTRCGAIEAAVKGGQPHGHLADIVEALAPAVAAARPMPGDTVTNAARENVELCLRRLCSPESHIYKQICEGRLRVAGAIYDLQSGAVSILPSHSPCD
jgi:carbonic anhydrase